MLCDIQVDTLAAGQRQLFQNSRNEAGLQASSMAHLDCRLRLRRGARHLLLGKNGCGKTTLLRAVAQGKLEEWPPELKVFLVEQEAALDRELSPLDAVLATDSLRAERQAEAAQLEEACAAAANDGQDQEEIDKLMQRMFDLYDYLGDEDDSQRKHRAESILGGLGFDDETLGTKFGQLSGGWQVRVALAAGLFMSPALLLLDEPTNQLDLAAIGWLQDYLAHEYKGTVLCVSHDRAFINQVATEVVILSDHKLEYFSGTLDDFEIEAAKRSSNMTRQVAALQRKKDHIQKSIDTMAEAAARRQENRSANRQKNKYAVQQGGCRGSGGTTSTQITQRQKKLGRMGLEKTLDGKKYKAQNEEGPRIGSANNNDGGWVEGKMTAAPLMQREDPALQFHFDAEEPLNLREDEHLLELCDVGYSIDGTSLLSNVKLCIAEGCRIACVGRNGAGKTTLLEMLAGRIAPTCGSINQQRGLQIAYFNQHYAEDLFLPDTPVSFLQSALPHLKEDDITDALERFGVEEDIQSLPLMSLSGGQRVRVAFARLSLEKVHLLILDEPTNHLDIYAIEALIHALNTFDGGVIFVTHNQSLLQEVAQKVIVVRDGSASLQHLSSAVLSVKGDAIKMDNTILLN